MLPSFMVAFTNDTCTLYMRLLIHMVIMFQVRRNGNKNLYDQILNNGVGAGGGSPS